MKCGPAFFNAAPVVTAVTWNPSDKSVDITLSGSNLIATRSAASSGLRSARATKGIAHTLKGYFEVVITAMEAGGFILNGVGTGGASLSTYVGGDANGWGYYASTGEKVTNTVLSAYGSTYAQGNVIGVAFDNGKVWFSKNNIWQNSGDPVAGTGAAFSGITGTIYPMTSLNDGAGPNLDVTTGRFTSASFSYTPPSGFPAWFDA